MLVLRGLGGLSEIAGGVLGMSILTAVDLRGRCGLADLGCMGRRGLTEGAEEEEEEASSNTFSALELIPRVTDASNPTPCAPISVCLALEGAAPRDVAEVAFLSCLDVGFFFGDGDADFVFAPPPPPIITGVCPRPRALFNKAGLSLLILSLLLFSPTSMVETVTGIGVAETQLLTRAGDGFCSFGGGAGFRFFCTSAGELG
jgi:hypothetical protein